MNEIRYYIEEEFTGVPFELRTHDDPALSAGLRLSEIPNDTDWNDLITRVRASESIEIKLRYPENISVSLLALANYVRPNLTIALRKSTGNTVEAVGFKLNPRRYIVAVLSSPVDLRPTVPVRWSFDIESARLRYVSP